MIPLPWLPLAKYGAIALFLAVLGFGCYQQGKKAVQLEWDASRAKLAEERTALILAHTKEIERLTERQAEVNREVSENYEKQLADLGAVHAKTIASIRAAGGLRLPGSICAGSTTGQTPTEGNRGHNEDAPGTVALPKQVEERLFDLALEADQVTEQLRACQAWIREHGFY